MFGAGLAEAPKILPPPTTHSHSQSSLPPTHTHPMITANHITI